jgi:hypothetical protein
LLLTATCKYHHIGVGLEVGKQCKVVHQGKAMVDVDTGESLGGYEEQVGIIRTGNLDNLYRVNSGKNSISDFGCRFGK